LTFSRFGVKFVLPSGMLRDPRNMTVRTDFKQFIKGDST